MGLSAKVTSFGYTANSTSNIVLSGFGFQPKLVIVHYNGSDSATDAVGAKSIRQGWGFAAGASDQRSAYNISTLGGASSAGATFLRTDAVVCVADDTATNDGYITLSSFDSDGVTFAVPDAISVNLRVMVIVIGGTDITNVKGGTDVDNTTTGNKSISGLGFQPDIIFFVAPIDANNAAPGGSNSEGGISFGVAKASGAGGQYVVSGGEDDSSATMDTGGYIFDNEFLASPNTSTPTALVARKQLVSMDTDGFTFNQLELPQTAGSQFHYFAIKGGLWAVGDLLTQTDTTTTVTESGLAFQPALVVFASANRAKSTQDAGTAHDRISFGAATSTTERMAMAILDENATANAETACAIEYDEVYANISASDTIDGLMDLTAINSDGFSVIMDDADPAQCFVWWVAVGPSTTSTPISVTDSGSGADAIDSISMTGTVTDTGSGTETPTITADASVSDGGAGSDAVSITVSLDVSDTGAGADIATASETGGEVNVSDTGSGLDAVTVSADLSLSDTGAGSETIGGITAIVPVTDGGAGVDALAAITAVLSVADDGAGIDAVSSITVILSVTDAGSGADAPTVSSEIDKLVTDLGTGTDAIQSVTAEVGIADAGVGSDQVSVTVTLSVTDNAAGLDYIANLLAALDLADSGYGVEGVSVADSSKKIVKIDISLTRRTMAFVFTARSMEFGFSARKLGFSLAERAMTYEMTSRSIQISMEQ